MKERKLLVKILLMAGILGVFLTAGCARFPVERLGTESSDKRLAFETVYRGCIYYDEGNFFGTYIGYKFPENTFIDSEEQLQTFFRNSGIFFDSSHIDFDKYMLFVTKHETVSDSQKIKPYDILEISYNEEILDVLIRNSDSETIQPKKK